MSLLSRLERRAGYPVFNQYGTTASATYGNLSLLSSAGERVDEFTALGVSTVLACVSLLADSVASMPLRLYRKQGEQRVEQPLPDVLARPLLDMTTYELVHQTISCLLLHGNSYLMIIRDRYGEPQEVAPLHPYQMQVIPDDKQSNRRYIHLGETIPNEDMIHLRWFTPPQSLVGISPLNQQRTIIGLGLAMDRHLAQWYADGGTPSSVLETDGKMSPDAAQILRDTWEDTHRRRRRPAVLTDGLKWRPVSASAADLQYVESRNQVIADIARIFRVPPHMLGLKSDGQTYQNVESASINYLVHTLTPLIRRGEAAFSRLISGEDHIVFDTSVLLRVDTMQRFQIYKTAVSSGLMTPNEVRLREGLEPYPGGNYFVQVFQGSPLSGGELPVLGADAPTNTSLVGVQE